MGNTNHSPENFWNRELSWIEFNARILDEARDKNNPLFERLKFLSITASNLDEFFMVRVASLKDQVHAGYKKKDIAGMTSEEQLAAISERIHQFSNVQQTTYQRSLRPLMEDAGLHIYAMNEPLTPEDAAYVDQYFMDQVYPVLTPMAVDSSRPFPLIVNKTLNLAALIRKKGDPDAEEEFATVQVPSVLPRLVVLPETKHRGTRVILLEQVIARNMSRLF